MMTAFQYGDCCFYFGKSGNSDAVGMVGGVSHRSKDTKIYKQERISMWCFWQTPWKTNNKTVATGIPLTGTIFCE